MSKKDFSQQFPSPPQNEQVYYTSPEHPFPVFPNENETLNEDEPTNIIPEDLLPMLPLENESANNPPLEYEPNPLGLSDEQLRLLEQDEEVLREFEQAKARDEAACSEQEQEELLNQWEMGLFPEQLETSSDEKGWVSNDLFY